MKSSKVNTVKQIKNSFMVTIFYESYFSGIVIKGASTKWSVIFLNVY